jgi:hypothetical protein
VEATWRFGAPGFHLKLIAAEEGLNPAVRTLRLVVTPPSPPGPPVLAEATATYTEETDVEYKEVTILPDGPTLPVERIG